MDSLTQIVLGAAVGEAVAGRKLGNRAMLWGAIGGTIPDLDVVSSLWMTELEALASHRGITHSIVFAVVAPFALAWLVRTLYRNKMHMSAGWRMVVTGIAILLMALSVTGIALLTASPWITGLLCLTGIYLVWRLYRFYVRTAQPEIDLPYTAWYWLFFWVIVTHIILDCFTAFGTQVFLPVSNYRVAFNSIAVVDPMYTLPLLGFVILAACHRAGNSARALINWTGIAVSCVYLCTTVINKERVDGVFVKALEHRQIQVERCRTSPTIFNNILWNCTAESADAYYTGLYSIYDTDPKMHVLNKLPKHHDVRKRLASSEAYQTVYWFSDGYLWAERTDTGYVLTDLRFGAIRDSIKSSEAFVFRLVLTPEGDDFEVHEERSRPANISRELRQFIERIKGY